MELGIWDSCGFAALLLLFVAVLMVVLDLAGEFLSAQSDLEFADRFWIVMKRLERGGALGLET